jgi:SAM-dependent methyltransferase
LERRLKPKPLFIAGQDRRPTGILGFIVAWVMAQERANDNGIAISLLDGQDKDRVLDVGTGHGASLARFAVKGSVAGVDYSSVMIGVAKHWCAHRRKLLAIGSSSNFRAAPGSSGKLNNDFNGIRVRRVF